MPDKRPRIVVAAFLLGCLFCAVSVGLITAGRGAPAVFDGNETFSSILHAKNLLNFGPGVAAGLADESTSPRKEGHAVAHTHQGNFPRIYATILYALGLRDSTSQVIATTLPVGLAAIMLLFVGLYRYLGLGPASAAITVLVTDYVLFAQWQVVTYRLWHFVFTASLLALTILHHQQRKRWLLLAAFMTSLCIFYYEIVFAIFLSCSIALLNLWLWRREISKGVAFVAAQLAGAMAGGSIVTAQLVGYLGWNGFLTDLRLTYFGRNLGSDGGVGLADLRAFVEQNNIAFFYNFVDGNPLRSVGFVIDTMFRWGLQVYTPPFAFSILILALGIVLALFARTGAVRFPHWIIVGVAGVAASIWLFGQSVATCVVAGLCALLVLVIPPDHKREPQHIALSGVAMLIGGPAFVFLAMAATFPRFLGFEQAGETQFWTYYLMLAAAISGLLLLIVAHRTPEPQRSLPLDAALRGAALLCIAMAFAQFHYRLYDRSLAPLWEQALPSAFMSTALQRVGMIGAVASAVAIGTLGSYLPDPAREELRQVWRRGLALGGCFLAGLLFVILLFPGYVFSGYMVRYNNVLSLPFALLIGLVAYSVVTFTRTADSFRFAGASNRLRLAVRSLCATTAMFLVLWWVAIQAANARLFPPTGFDVLHALRDIEPRHPSIIANTYAVPFAIVTGQWGYLDHTFSEGRIAFTPAAGFGHPSDKKYVWFADRENPEYGKPDVFVCLLPRTYWSAALEFGAPEKANRCSQNGIVHRAERPADGMWPLHNILARDRSGRDGWAIVKLDWDFSPYLAEPPRIAIESRPDSIGLTVTYAFAHQNGQPEHQTDVEIWAVSQYGRLCVIEGRPLAAAKALGGRITMAMPPSDAETEFIAIARPRTSTRVGRPFFSAPFYAEAAAAKTGLHACQILRDETGRHWERVEGGSRG